MYNKYDKNQNLALILTIKQVFQNKKKAPTFTSQDSVQM